VCVCVFTLFMFIFMFYVYVRVCMYVCERDSVRMCVCKVCGVRESPRMYGVNCVRADYRFTSISVFMLHLACCKTHRNHDRHAPHTYCHVTYLKIAVSVAIVDSGT
jgi:hypothetical protein